MISAVHAEIYSETRFVRKDVFYEINSQANVKKTERRFSAHKLFKSLKWMQQSYSYTEFVNNQYVFLHKCVHQKVTMKNGYYMNNTRACITGGRGEVFSLVTERNYVKYVLQLVKQNNH